MAQRYRDIIHRADDMPIEEGYRLLRDTILLGLPHLDHEVSEIDTWDVRFTGMEYRAMKAFVRRPRSNFTLAQLASICMKTSPGAELPVDSTVRKAISGLRKKLPPERGEIRIQREVGYRFVPGPKKAAR